MLHRVIGPRNSRESVFHMYPQDRQQGNWFNPTTSNIISILFKFLSTAIILNLYTGLIIFLKPKETKSKNKTKQFLIFNSIKISQFFYMYIITRISEAPPLPFIRGNWSELAILCSWTDTEPPAVFCTRQSLQSYVGGMS